MSEGKREEHSNGFELSSNPKAIMDAANVRSNSLSALANSTDWVDPYFDKIQVIRKTFLSDLVMIYKRMPEVFVKPTSIENPTSALVVGGGRCRQSVHCGHGKISTERAPDAGGEMKAQRYKIFLERIIRFLHMSKDDLMKQRKENVERFMKELVYYIERVKAKKSAALNGPSKNVTEAPIEPPPNPSKTLSLSDNQPSHSQVDPQQPTGDFLIQEEIREVNKSLIETTVDVVDVDNSETGYIKGIVVRCLYNGPPCYENAHMLNAPVRPFKSLLLEMLVPEDYPNSTPIVLERLHPGRRESLETKALRKKATSIFSSMLWKFSRPISLKNMAKTWDACARQECFEFAKKLGRGGDFMSTYISRKC